MKKSDEKTQKEFPEGLTEPGEGFSQSTIVEFPTTFGRYQELTFLGEGGMARVYKAYDPTLQRHVALKFIRGDDPQLGHRLFLEARAQARIEHDHVCKVFEAGEVDGRLYIAMQYIKGKTLRELIKEMTLQQKAKIMKQVAAAVHEAHRVGLIHRDLKPSNVMVERTEDGDWVPYVMDFGLAREVESAGLTMTGVVVGSPYYMPPEQAKGEAHKLDRRSDVYGLGATFYELLTGKMPFDEGPSLEVLMKIIHEEPIPPRKRDSAIPSELETIVMKCLEKEQERRYDSAKALGEDLERYLNGDTILAQPSGLLYRSYKQARKHKAIVVTISLALLLVLFFAGISIRAYWTSQEQAALAQQFGVDVKEMEAILRFAHTMPLHDIRPQLAMVRDRMERVKQKMRTVGKAGSVPGQYALGRGYLALGDYDSARTHLELAWQSGYQDPAVAYALGQSLGGLYQREMEKAERIQASEFSRKQIEKNYRDPALRYLKRSTGVQIEAPAYVEGLIAFYENRYDQALEKSRQASGEIPWLYEARKLEGDAWSMIGKEKQEKGEYEEAITSFDRAGVAYQNAIDMARSDPAVYEGQCSRWTSVMEAEAASGASPRQAFDEAIRSCEQSLMANPENGQAYRTKSWTFWRWGEYQAEHGQDPVSSLRQSIQMAEEAVRLEPREGGAYAHMGAAYSTLAEYEQQHGIDPRVALQSAIQSCRMAIRINPNEPDSYNLVGYSFLTMGEYEMDLGLDPRPSLVQAVESFQKTLRINPGFYKAHNNIGYAYLDQGKYELERGLDARSSLNQAIEEFGTTVQKNPNYASAYNNRGIAYAKRAVYEMRNGLDPRTSLDQAIQSSQRVIPINPGSAFVYNTIGFSYLIKAQYEMAVGGDPQSSLDHSIENLKKALQINPDFDLPYFNISLCHQTLAQFQLERGINPSLELDGARAALRNVMRINPRYGTGPELAQTELIAAQWAMRRKESPAPFFQSAAPALQKAFQANTESPDVFLAAAEFHRWKSQSTSSPEDEIEQGLAMVEKALAINPQMAKAHAIKGVLLLLRARFSHSADDAKQAEAALTTGLSINKNLARTYEAFLREAKTLH